MHLNQLDSDEDWGDLGRGRKVNGSVAESKQPQSNLTSNHHQSHQELYNTQAALADVHYDHGPQIVQNGGGHGNHLTDRNNNNTVIEMQ